MRSLYIISEGRTECGFIKNVLAEHLIQFDWLVIPITLPTGKNKVGVHKGGWRRSDGYQNAIKQIVNTINMNKNATYTTLFDLYGFPMDIPCYDESKRLSSPYDKAKLFENQIKQDVNRLFIGDQSYNDKKFIPYIQPYEFEAFLFVDAYSSAFELSVGDDSLAKTLENGIKKIASQFETPEHINNSSATAPSKRIETLVPGFVKNKAGKAGLSWKAAQSAGLLNIRKACFHFDEWLSYLETHS